MPQPNVFEPSQRARPSEQQVEILVTVQIGRDQRFVDGKSIMNVMLLAAPLGSQVDLLVTGPDEEDAFSELSTLIRRGFEEDVVDD